MSDIELVIKMPEKIYKHIMSMQFYIPGSRNGKSILEDILKAIRTGKPLPKGHGRILDEKNILDTTNNDGGWYDLTDMSEYIAGVKAIIEADTESEVANGR